MNILHTDGKYIINGIQGQLGTDKIYCQFYGYDDKIKVDMYLASTMEPLFMNLWISEFQDENGNTETTVQDWITNWYPIIIGYKDNSISTSGTGDWYEGTGELIKYDSEGYYSIVSEFNPNFKNLKFALSIDAPDYTQAIEGFVFKGLNDYDVHQVIAEITAVDLGVNDWIYISRIPDTATENQEDAEFYNNDFGFSNLGSDGIIDLDVVNTEFRYKLSIGHSYRFSFIVSKNYYNQIVTHSINATDITSYGAWELDTTGVDASNQERQIAATGSSTLTAPYRFRRSVGSGNNYEYLNVTDSSVTITETNCTLNKANGKVNVPTTNSADSRTVSIRYQYSGVDVTWYAGTQVGGVISYEYSIVGATVGGTNILSNSWNADSHSGALIITVRKHTVINGSDTGEYEDINCTSLSQLQGYGFQAPIIQSGYDSEWRSTSSRVTVSNFNSVTIPVKYSIKSQSQGSISYAPPSDTRQPYIYIKGGRSANYYIDIRQDANGIRRSYDYTSYRVTTREQGRSNHLNRGESDSWNNVYTETAVYELTWDYGTAKSSDSSSSNVARPEGAYCTTFGDITGSLDSSGDIIYTVNEDAEIGSNFGWTIYWKNKTANFSNGWVDA